MSRCAWVCSHAMPDAPDVDASTCAICLDSLSDDASTITLPCSHKFHGQCAVNLFRFGDPRCPLCRDHPQHKNDSDEDDIDDETHEHTRVTFCEALREAARNHVDASTQRMKGTVRKWKKERREARKAMRDQAAKILTIEQVVDQKIQTYSDKLYAAFDAKNKTDLDKLKEMKRMFKRANTQCRSAEFRLAKSTDGPTAAAAALGCGAAAVATTCQ